MGNNISLYPTLDKELLKKLECEISDFKAGYSNGQETFELLCKVEDSGKNSVVSVADESGRWALDKHNVEFSGQIRIKNISCLFGKKGIVGDDAELGLGLTWKSKLSGTRGSRKIASINSDDDSLDIEFKKAFSASTLRGNIELGFQLYLINPGENEELLPPGIMFGEVNSVTVILEGIGSTFTVFEKSVPGEPLWNVECEWDDPEYSQFSECVKVIINTAHPAWVQATEDEIRKELLKEIMASSMQIIISELEPEQRNPDGEYEPGSVCDAIAYFITRADLNLDSNASIAKSIRAYLDKNMK